MIERRQPHIPSIHTLILLSHPHPKLFLIYTTCNYLEYRRNKN